MKETYHGLPVQRLKKAVQDPCERVRTHTRSPHQTRILLHAFLPVVAHYLQRRHSRPAVTSVVLVLARTPSHLSHDLMRGFARFLVNVGLNCRPKGIDDIHAECYEEEVEEDLGIVAEDMGEAGMALDEVEDGGDQTHFVGRRTLMVCSIINVPSRSGS